MDDLRANIARLPLRVLHARLRRDRDGLFALLVGMILLGTAAFSNLLAALIVAAFFPVFFLARSATIACFAAAALLGGHLWQRGSACGACREDHLYEGSTLTRVGKRRPQ
jgi:uncharacterized membrane protein YqjE